MNRIFKTVWNAVRRCLVVVNEATKSTAQARLSGSIITLSIGMLLPFFAQAADWYPWYTGSVRQWMTVSTANSTYDNFYWTSGSGTNNFILGGPAYSNITNATMNILGDFNMTFSSAYFLLAEANDKTYSKGTLNIKGNAYIQNGASLYGAGSVDKGQNPTTEAVLNIQGTAYVNNGSYLVGGGSNRNNHNVQFLINQLVIGDQGIFKTGNSPNGHMTFSGQFNDITVEHGGQFIAHNDSKGLTSTVVIKNTLIFEPGSTLENYKGLVIGSSRENFVAVGNTVSFDHATVTENMTLAQEQGTINVAGDGYVFADFKQTGGVFNNNGDITFNGASLDAGQFVNSGVVSFTGDSIVNKVIEGNGAVNIIDGTFVTDHFENGSVSIQDGVATINQLTETVHHTMTGGELHTGVGEIFDSLGVMGDGELNVISLNATMPETIRTELTAFFKKYVPGFVKENLDQYASFNGGKIVLKVGDLTETQVADLQAAFKETFASTKYQETIPFIPLFSAYLQYSRLV